MGLFSSPKVYVLLRHFDFEGYVWIAAIIFLGCINPSGESHFSFCLFKNLGISFCPGCGLGRSISFLLHGDVVRSFHAHPLGIVALPVLLHRIGALARHSYVMNNLYSQ